MVALFALVVLAIIAYSVWEIASGLFELIIGLAMMIIGAFLFCLSFPVEIALRAFRVTRRKKTANRSRFY